MVTAAHCLSSVETVDVYFGIGDYGFTKVIGIEPKDHYIHPGFLNDKGGNDIGKKLDKAHIW